MWGRQPVLAFARHGSCESHALPCLMSRPHRVVAARAARLVTDGLVEAQEHITQGGPGGEISNGMSVTGCRITDLY